MTHALEQAMRLSAKIQELESERDALKADLARYAEADEEAMRAQEEIGMSPRRASEAIEILAKERDDAIVERARLKPTGKVAEDAEEVEKAIEDLMEIKKDIRSRDARDRARHLAAKAQGYDVAIEAQEQMRVAFKQELDAAQADARKAGEEWGRMKAERDAAVADNAALLAVLRDAVFAMEHACDTVNEMDAVDPDQDAEAMAAVERVTTAMEQIDAASHPGAALLEQHREALAAAARRHETTRACMVAREQYHSKANESVRDVLAAAYKYADKPHLLYSAVARMAKAHDDSPDIAEAMATAYDHYDRHRKELAEARNEGIEKAALCVRDDLGHAGAATARRIRSLKEKT